MLCAKQGSRHDGSRCGARTRCRDLSSSAKRPSLSSSQSSTVDHRPVPGIDSRQRAFGITKDLMKRSAFSTHAWRLSVLSLGFGTLFSLAGCDTLNDWLAPDTVNYKGAETAPSLTVPSDLSKADI